jgi:hypothetical protein
LVRGRAAPNERQHQARSTDRFFERDAFSNSTFPGLELGIAEYDEGPTGCTVFSFGRRASVSIEANAEPDEVTLGEIESDAMWDAILSSYDA